MAQKIITLDSQILNSISLCERRTQYAHIDSLSPLEKAEPLERGDLLHKMVEVHESLRCGLQNFESKTWRALIESGVKVEEAPEEYAIKAAKFFAMKMDLGTDEVAEVIYQFQEYNKYYADDMWQSLAVEAVGSKLLFENEEYKFIYTFVIDRVCQKDNIIVPWDYKSSKKRKTPSQLSNQFMGYCWALDSNYCMVDKIGFQKTLKPEERFQRFFLSYDSDRLLEWKMNSVRWAIVYANLLEDPNGSTMNLTSCDKYNGCIYAPICERTPEAREDIIKRDYRIAETWDPAKVLEEK